MKLLLTSNGLFNDSIANAFHDLVGKKPQNTKVAFIPSAANPDRSSKEWLILDQYRILERGYNVDIIELTAITPERLKTALENVDVIFIGGGNTFYLSFWMQKSGLFALLPELLKTKVYAGISAGSMIIGQSLVLTSQALKNTQAFVDEDYDELGPEGESSGKTLKLVDFIFRPHLNSRYFNLARMDILEQKVKQVDFPVYALDDNSGLKIVDGDIKIISEGVWKFFDKN